MNANAVFVYGTLRRGGSNHFRMAGADFLGEGKISGRMYQIEWYPALVCGGSRWVKGELYRLSDSTLGELDIFEGIHIDPLEVREYRRVRTMVTLSGGGREEAWVWEWAGDVSHGRELEGEDWLAYEPNPS